MQTNFLSPQCRLIIFCECKSLSTVTFGVDALSQVCREFFGVEDRIKSVIIPSTVKELGKRCFYKCTSLHSVRFQEDDSLLVGCESLVIREYAFAYTNIEYLFIPYHAEKLEAKCFYGCQNLHTVVLQDMSIVGEKSSRLEAIGEKAFADTNIDSIFIPLHVKQLGDRCFDQCMKLKDVVFSQDSKLNSIGTAAFMRDVVKKFVLPRDIQQVLESCVPDATYEYNDAYEEWSEDLFESWE